MQERCYYCNTLLIRFVSNRKHRVCPKNGYTRDHLIPKDRGGSGTHTVACCATCNVDKARLTLEEYRVVCAFRQGIVAIDVGLMKFPGEQ